MRAKTVTLICHGVITVDPRNETAWEDVWVRFRHNGKQHSYGPTLTGRADLDGELEMSEELQEKHKDDPECDWSEEITEMKRVIGLLDSGQRVAIGDDWEKGTPTIYFAEDYFNQAGAEEMIRAMLAHLGHQNVNLKWKRETDIVVGAISIAPKRLREAAV